MVQVEVLIFFDAQEIDDNKKEMNKNGCFKED